MACPARDGVQQPLDVRGHGAEAYGRAAGRGLTAQSFPPAARRLARHVHPQAVRELPEGDRPFADAGGQRVRRRQAGAPGFGGQPDRTQRTGQREAQECRVHVAVRDGFHLVAEGQRAQFD
jgi:hypothetical protein